MCVCFALLFFLLFAQVPHAQRRLERSGVKRRRAQLIKQNPSSLVTIRVEFETLSGRVEKKEEM